MTGLESANSKSDEEKDRVDPARYAALRAELREALAREAALLRDKSELLSRQDRLMLEFDHRLFNSLQMVTSLLSMQSRLASPEAAAQLHAAGQRVAAFGRVHRRLHPLNHHETVECRE